MPIARLLILLAPVSLGLAQIPAPLPMETGSANRMITGQSDGTFLLNAIQASRGEVDRCRMAIAKATHRKIRGYAEMMVDTHVRFTAQLEALAKQKGLTVPRGRPPIPISLTHLKGSEYDREFRTITVATQEKVLEAFQNEAQSGTDPEIKNFATKSIPPLLEKLDLARDLKH